jgi:MFS transporter, DHA1 family, multidrug resistance protein
MKIINKSLGVLFFGNSLLVFASSLLGPLYAIFVNGIDAKVLSVSLSWFAFLASAIFFTYLVGRYGDKLKEKEYMLMGGYIIKAVVWLSFIFVSNIRDLIILQILLGISEALGNPSFDTIFAAHLEDGKHIANYSTWKMIEQTATALGTLIGGIIVTIFGFSPLFAIMSSTAAISFFIVLLQPRKLL